MYVTLKSIIYNSNSFIINSTKNNMQSVNIFSHRYVEFYISTVSNENLKFIHSLKKYSKN